MSKSYKLSRRQTKNYSARAKSIAIERYEKRYGREEIRQAYLVYSK